jgi:hypothetical protein
MKTIILETSRSSCLQVLFNYNEGSILHQHDSIKVLARYVEQANAYIVKKKIYLKNLLKLKTLTVQEKEALTYLYSETKYEEEIIIPIDECIEDVPAFGN